MATRRKRKQQAEQQERARREEIMRELSDPQALMEAQQNVRYRAPRTAPIPTISYDNCTENRQFNGLVKKAILKRETLTTPENGISPISLEGDGEHT